MHAADDLPRQKLAISFDLDEHLVKGNARIDIPPGSGADLLLEGLEVASLTIDGEPVTAAAGANLLIEPTGPAHSIVVNYRKRIPPQSAGPAAGFISRDGITLTGFWHPILAGQEAIYELTAVVPENFAAVSEAEEITATKTPAGKEIHFSFPYGLTSIDFIAGPYTVKKWQFGHGKELYTYFFAEDRDLADDYGKKALGYLNRYEKLLGPYPYKRFSVVENRLPTGYAMPTFTLLGQAVVRLPFITDTSLGHEVLHAWFGNSIRIKADEGNWAEGLTTYLADQSFAADRGEGAAFRKGQLINYQSYVAPDNTMTLEEFVNPLSHTTPLGKEIRAIGYSKCSMLFHMLRKKVGDEKFYAALRDFYAGKVHQRAGWSDIIASFEKVTQLPLADFFHQWLEHPEIPGITIKNAAINDKDGQTVLSFDLVQEQETPFILDVPVAVTTPYEKVKQVLAVTERSTPVAITLAARPTELVLDGHYDLMRVLTPDELPPVWSRFEGARNKLAVVAGAEQAEIYAPLIELLKGMDCRIADAGEVTDADLAESAVIFLGSDQKAARALFASVAHPAEGFTVDIRSNPLNPKAVAVLVSSENRDETARGAAKLTHYGKYSYLHFKNGRIREKNIRQTEAGERFLLDPPPDGIEVSGKLGFEDIVERLAGNRVLYVGETHTSNEDHQLQLRLIRAMYNRNPNLAIGMEMFSKPAQEVLNAYINREIDEWEFLKKSHYFEKWSFDYRLYRDIINFARAHDIPVIALNIEKEIVSKVFKQGGISALSDEEKALIPEERDLDLPGYRDRIAGAFSMHSSHVSNPKQISNFLQAQALWDEAMAQSVVDYLRANPDRSMVVIAGQGHTNKATGIPPRVARRLPVRQAVVLNVREQEIGPDAADFLMFSAPAPLEQKPLLGVMLAETDQGVTVMKLSPHGKAAAAGIKPNDVILAINNEPIGAIEDLKIVMLYLDKGATARLRIKRERTLLPDRIMTIDVAL